MNFKTIKHLQISNKKGEINWVMYLIIALIVLITLLIFASDANGASLNIIERIKALLPG